MSSQEKYNVTFQLKKQTRTRFSKFLFKSRSTDILEKEKETVLNELKNVEWKNKLHYKRGDVEKFIKF